MRRLSRVCLSLLSLMPSASWAQISPSSTIGLPDGKRTPTLAPRPMQPSLEEQLQRRKKQEEARPLPDATEPATPTDELLGPLEKEQIEAMQKQGIFPETDPRFRMSLGLALPSASRVGGVVKSWQFEPGIVVENAWRLTDPKKSSTFWLGMRLAAWNGTAASTESFSRFAILYIGPLLAFDWKDLPEPGSKRSLWRQNLAFGIAGFSRQADPNFPGTHNATATKALGLDGAGLWLNVGVAYQWLEGFELESKLGLQSGAAYTLSYLSLGVSLWTE